MRTHYSVSMLAASLALALSCCTPDDPCLDPDVECDCEYGLMVQVNFPNDLPEKIQILWNGEVAFDECQWSENFDIAHEKWRNQLRVWDVNYTFGPDATFSLEVIDLKDCSAAPEKMFSVQDQHAPPPPTDSWCSSFNSVIYEK